MDEKKEEVFNSEDFALFEDVMETLDDVKADEELDQEVQELAGKKPESEDNDDAPDSTLTTDDEVVVEDEVDETVDNSDEEVKTDDEESSLFTPYVKLLVDEGVFSVTDVEKFDGTVEGLKKAMSDEVGYYVDQYKEQMPQEVKRLLDGYEQGVPFDEMIKISSDRIRYDNIEEAKLTDDVDMQKKLVLDYLDQTTQLPDKLKSKMIEQFEDSMELEDQSKMALGELKNIQDNKEREAITQQEAQKVEFQKQQELIVNNLNRHINDTSEIIPGLKLNQKMKDDIRTNLTVPVEYDNYGNPINKLGKYMRDNPIEGEVVLNYIFELSNGFQDWSPFSKAGKSQAIKEMESAAKVADGKNKGSRTTSKSSAARGDLARGIEGFLRG